MSSVNSYPYTRLTPSAEKTLEIKVLLNFASLERKERPHLFLYPMGSTVKTHVYTIHPMNKNHSLSTIETTTRLYYNSKLIHNILQHFIYLFVVLLLLLLYI